jgi:hypothetical protein
LNKLPAALIACLLIGCSGLRSTSGESDLLQKIAAQLKAARALPPGQASNFECPGDASSLAGISPSRLKEVLGEPDALIGGSEDAVTGPGWMYSFAGPTALSQRGGGYANLMFYFDFERRRVESVSCSYAQ